ncbi:MAG TPA: DUF362 domain-containing protein, partial [Rectinemataceae bacterium]
MKSDTSDGGAERETVPYDVALVSCQDYSADALEEALSEAARAAGMPDPRGLRVLVKPNLLKGAAPERAVATHPEFLRAAIRILKAKGAASVMVGDSPAWQGSAAAAR